MSTLQDWKKQLGEAESRIALRKRDRAIAADALVKREELLVVRKEALTFFTTAANTAQRKVSGVISAIVTNGVRLVHGKEYEFEVRFVTRRNSTEADLVLKKNGHEVDILGNSGLGVANIIAITTRAALILLGGRRDRFMLLDEPTAALMVSKQELAGKVLQALCKNMGFQIMLTTHSPELAECADRVYHVSMNGAGESSVKLIQDKSEIRSLVE
jgi:DNA repair exonuclease SbcCD ATPase subunit